MKHPSTRQLFAHWNQRRGNRPAPERSDIEPAAIRSVLGDSFILLFEPSLDHPFRLAGTRVCAAFGRELKGEPFVHLWDARDRARIRDIMTIVADEAIGTVAGVTANAADEASLDLELILLPLRHHGDLHARMLGILAPSARPFWLGRTPVTSLALGSLRHLDPAREIAVSSALHPADGHPSARGRFLVYDGGRPHACSGAQGETEAPVH
jgi:hypothetical protein